MGEKCEALFHIRAMYFNVSRPAIAFQPNKAYAALTADRPLLMPLGMHDKSGNFG